MKENPDIWIHLGDWLVSIKEQGIGAVLAGTMAFLRGVIPPFFMEVKSRIQATRNKCCFGVYPPNAILG
ncbi:phage holin family protein, partial [Xenorhabdus bovienii]|uniref:phage holin family protein n=1 Tax=Xenorhabdus bovienii TaxID=40576 RepID=UPI0030BA22F6